MVERKLYVERWAKSLARQTDMDIDKRSLTQRYNIKNSKLRFLEEMAKRLLEGPATWPT